MSEISSLSKFGENCINGFLAEIIAIQDFRDNGYMDELPTGANKYLCP